MAELVLTQQDLVVVIFGIMENIVKMVIIKLDDFFFYSNILIYLLAGPLIAISVTSVACFIAIILLISICICCKKRKRKYQKKWDFN